MHAVRRAQVRVDVWERGSVWPTGHVVRPLGRINDMRAETDALLVQAGVVHQVSLAAFSATILRYTSRPYVLCAPDGPRAFNHPSA